MNVAFFESSTTTFCISGMILMFLMSIAVSPLIQMRPERISFATSFSQNSLEGNRYSLSAIS
ncbi:MAG: hypothetical protein JW738_04835 [Actinobacteria bacterium]|nr:hypothetical protein [Actinomycetota bacterium]